MKDIKILLILFHLKKRKINQSTFAPDRTTNMQFRKMQNEIYGSFVTIQYHSNVTNRFTESSQTIFFL